MAVDNCCAIRTTAEEAIPSLKAGIIVSPLVAFLELEIEPDWDISYYNTTSSINTNFSVIMESCMNQDNVVLGFDIEWPVGGKVALVQIAVESTRFFSLFHLMSGMPMPNALKSLLQNPNIGKCKQNLIYHTVLTSVFYREGGK